MSVRVNLLPSATRERSRVARQRGGIAAALLALVLILALVWFLQDRTFRNAEAELATEEAEVSRLRAERGELAPYADLDARLTAADDRVRTAMNGEVSFAGIMQDVAAVTPSDTGLLSMSINLDRRPDETAPAPGLPFGTVNLNGQSLTGHAPGVERFLLELDKIRDFAEPFFNSSALDEDGVATFNLDVGLLPTARTERYEDGVPEELR